MSDMQKATEKTQPVVRARPSQPGRPHVFIVRVRLIELGEGSHEWRGDVQYALSRERRYFREGSALIDFVLEQLQTAQAEDSSQGEQHE